MRNVRNLGIAAVIAIMAWLAPSPAAAVAVVSPTTTFYFSGDCVDCTGTGNAELVLSNYTYGQNITAANFVSFHYDGTNLFSPFTITSPNFISGQIVSPLPAPQTVQISDNSRTFNSSVSGNWAVGTVSLASLVIDDMGRVSTYALSVPVPEPVSMSLLLTGVAGAFVFRRRLRS